MKAQKDALFFALGLLVGIVVAHSVIASRSVTRSQVEENGFRLVRERIGFATKAHRKAIQEYVRHYRAAYRDDLNIEGADENAREEMDERGTVMNDDKFALVVSVYKEWGENNEKVPEWANANASRDNYFVVQPFYQRIEASKPAFVVNKGFESGVYMRYIVDNYHNLPEAVIFVQADGCEVDMNAVLPRVTLEILDQAGGFLPLNCLKVMGRSISMWGGEKGERVEACWREVSKHFELNLFEGFALGSDFQINMVCCACFAVKRELLLSTPFEVWNSFYERSIVKGQCIEGQLDIDEGKHETAGTFEHLAHVIFGRKDRLWEPKCFDDFAIIVNNEDAPGSLKQSEVHATDRVENRVDVTVNSQKAKENTTETLPEAFRLLSNKLMKNQYRDSCTAACFYSTKFSPEIGLGGRLQFIVAALTFAIEDGCVLIASPDSSLQLFGGSSLKELTNCKDEDAKDIKYIDSGASDMDENGLLARYMRYVPQFDDLGLKGSIMLWQSVALSFLMRATESFANIIQEVQNEIGWYDIQKCRGAVISMHVRHGDKGTETSLLPLSAYLKELALWLENAEQNQEFKCIFVATDDGDLQKRLEDSPVLELESGRKFKVIGSWQSNVAAQKLSSSEGEFGALLDLHLLSRAKTFCFTFSSNFGRLAMHMNPVHLEARAVSSLIPMDYYHHAISSGFFFVRQQNVRRGSWSTVAVYKEKISSTLNCEPQYGCSAQTFDSSQNETYSCCRLPAKSDYVNGVIGPVLSEIFPDEYEKYCRVIDDY